MGQQFFAYLHGVPVFYPVQVTKARIFLLHGLSTHLGDGMFFLKLWPSFLNLVLLDAGTLILDFTPDVHIEDVKSILTQHKNKFAVLLCLFTFY